MLHDMDGSSTGVSQSEVKEKKKDVTYRRRWRQQRSTVTGISMKGDVAMRGTRRTVPGSVGAPLSTGGRGHSCREGNGHGAGRS